MTLYDDLMRKSREQPVSLAPDGQFVVEGNPEKTITHPLAFRAAMCVGSAIDELAALHRKARRRLDLTQMRAIEKIIGILEGDL